MQFPSLDPVGAGLEAARLEQLAPASPPEPLLDGDPTGAAPTLGLGSPALGLGSPTLGLGSPTLGLGSPAPTADDRAEGPSAPERDGVAVGPRKRSGPPRRPDAPDGASFPSLIGALVAATLAPLDAAGPGRGGRARGSLGPGGDPPTAPPTGVLGGWAAVASAFDAGANAAAAIGPAAGRLPGGPRSGMPAPDLGAASSAGPDRGARSGTSNRAAGNLGALPPGGMPAPAAADPEPSVGTASEPPAPGQAVPAPAPRWAASRPVGPVGLAQPTPIDEPPPVRDARTPRLEGQPDGGATSAVPVSATPAPGSQPAVPVTKRPIPERNAPEPTPAGGGDPSPDGARAPGSGSTAAAATPTPDDRAAAPAPESPRRSRSAASRSSGPERPDAPPAPKTSSFEPGRTTSDAIAARGAEPPLPTGPDAAGTAQLRGSASAAADRLLGIVAERLRLAVRDHLPSVEATFHDPALGTVRLAVRGLPDGPIDVLLVVASQAAARALERAAGDAERRSADLAGLDLRIRVEAAGPGSVPGEPRTGHGNPPHAGSPGGSAHERSGDELRGSLDGGASARRDPSGDGPGAGTAGGDGRRDGPLPESDGAAPAVLSSGTARRRRSIEPEAGPQPLIRIHRSVPTVRSGGIDLRL